MKYLLIIKGLFLVTVFHAQVLISGNNKADIQCIKDDYLKNKGNLSEEILDRFAVYRLNDEYYVSFLGEKNDGFLRSDLTFTGVLLGAEAGAVLSLRIPLRILDQIEKLPGLRSLELAGKIKPYGHSIPNEFQQDRSFKYAMDIPNKYSGKNVIIGVADWGFDYSSPVFFDSVLKKTRVLAVWDQFKREGPSPLSFNYGTEFVALPEFKDVGFDTSNLYKPTSQGNFVLSLAGGNGLTTAYHGVAKDASFLLSSVLPDEASVLDAWEWMHQKSLQESKRLVLSVSWGRYHLGVIDGNSLLSQAIDKYAAAGVVFCASVGNNGVENFHIRKDFLNDSIRSIIGFHRTNPISHTRGQSIYAWGVAVNTFECALEFCHNSGAKILHRTPYYSTATTVTYIDTFWIHGRDTIFYNISADASHPQNGRPQMRIRVKNTSSLKVILNSRAKSGVVHFWNITESSHELSKWVMPFQSDGMGTIAGDHHYGIFEPASANHVIAVTAYFSEHSLTGKFASISPRASFSAVGPRCDGLIKPDIAAPGAHVVSGISSSSDQPNESMETIYFEGRKYPFIFRSGTTYASPIVAGVVALLLEANPYLSVEQVKQILLETAREDKFTGVIPIGGSTFWGSGKLDAKTAIRLASVTVGTEAFEDEKDWEVFPEKTHKYLYFTLLDELPPSVQLIDSKGKVMERGVVHATLYVGDLLPGAYIIRFERRGRMQQSRFKKW